MTEPVHDEPLVPDRRQVRRRQYIALAGIVLVTVGFAVWALWTSFQPKGEVRRPPEKPVARNIEAPGPVDPRDVWIAKSEKELLELRQSRDRLEKELEALREELAAVAERPEKPKVTPPVAGDEAPGGGEAASRPLASRLPPLPTPPVRSGASSATPASTGTGAETASRTSAPAPSLSAGQILPPPPGIAGGSAGAGAGRKSGIEELEIPLPEAGGGKEVKNLDNYIPAGSFGRAILLSGIDAPTGGAAQNNPVPFVVKLKDHGRLPNGYRSRIKACHVVLAGYGDISSERVYARTETLSCVMQDGRILETAVRGYISGEDGKAGLRGRLVSKQGALIARALLAGIFGGVGQGISQSYQTLTTSALGTVSTVDPNKVLEQGVAKGFGSALDRISKWYLERADETYPVIEADAARIVDIVLTQGASLGEAAAREEDAPRRTLVTEADRRRAATLEKKP